MKYSCLAFTFISPFVASAEEVQRNKTRKLLELIYNRLVYEDIF